MRRFKVKCDSCNGTGNNGNCDWCEGAGYKIVTVHDDLVPIGAFAEITI